MRDRARVGYAIVKDSTYPIKGVHERNHAAAAAWTS